MFEIRRYTSDCADEWNRFVAASKNGTFLFNRSYMDYHADRFCDGSLMVYRRNKLYALFPCNIKEEISLDTSNESETIVEKVVISHGGLTYGGLIMNEKATAKDVLEVFKMLQYYFRQTGCKRVIYKPTPWIYHRQPAEEDYYAIVELFGARLKERALSSTISRELPNPWYRIRSCGAKKAQASGIIVRASNDLPTFWHILTENLAAKYSLKPVHTIEEITRLQTAFPNNIKLYAAYLGEQMLGGTLLYITPQVVHSQYISANEEGKRLHALDLLFRQVIETSLKSHPYFDFGISTEEHGTILNEDLIYQKEGFGGRGICYDIYEWDV